MSVLDVLPGHDPLVFELGPDHVPATGWNLDLGTIVVATNR